MPPLHLSVGMLEADEEPIRKKHSYTQVYMDVHMHVKTAHTHTWTHGVFMTKA